MGVQRTLSTSSLVFHYFCQGICPTWRFCRCRSQRRFQLDGAYTFYFVLSAMFICYRQLARLMVFGNENGPSILMMAVSVMLIFIGDFLHRCSLMNMLGIIHSYVLAGVHAIFVRSRGGRDLTSTISFILHFVMLLSQRTAWALGSWVQCDQSS
ncbi:uncharacterized protein EI90DRAFT_2550959 [Cantharellus anzutake]|uniref:uncharacterized protein n=1 Tax=Cantharellus anzutake TaxID=1750568 RepID=UPI001902FAB1|nr:uncharacterized protein EI90DRAFT_2550959 [Cantharellus anzutake]KAF8338156.1 hypothetical protein EI90DRAFT_2550959 [Cantharellus anzutake]